MDSTKTNEIFLELQRAFREEVRRHRLSGRKLSVHCKALSARQAIGSPDHQDYAIIRGRESIVEAVFESSRGQAFSDEFEDADYGIEELPAIELDSNRRRAHFVAGLNAVFRSLGLAEKTVHCKDCEPKECAKALGEIFDKNERILLVGLQPRFLEFLAARGAVRVLDLDSDNIGATQSGVKVEPPENFEAAAGWCDRVLATGSTLVNGTIGPILSAGKPVIFYGVTISAAARVLNLDAFCAFGH